MQKTYFELNKELFDAAEKGDFAKVEALLQMGADPLGSSDENYPDEDILGELFCCASSDSETAEHMPQLVQLFLTYGMDIENRNIPTDDGDKTNPLWSLAFCQDEHGLRTLKVLLDNALDCKSAEDIVEHIITDMAMCDGCEIEDEWFLGRTVCALKMIMLVASYPHIIEGSQYIRECVELDKNRTENLTMFRNWNGFEYHIDTSTCTNIPYGLRDATLKIQDKQTKEAVWTLII